MPNTVLGKVLAKHTVHTVDKTAVLAGGFYGITSDPRLSMRTYHCGIYSSL